jgi:Ca2+-binding RTX toxin-like protein
MFGGYGNDVLSANEYGIEMDGGPGADRLGGASGRDHLFGESGGDANFGGPGSDLCRSPQRGPRAPSCER